MRSKVSILVLSAVVLGLPIGARVHANQQQATPPVAGRTNLGTTVAQAELISTGWRMSKIMGADVRNEKGDKVGKVEDILVSSDGTLSTAIIEVGGFVGMGGHKVAIPVQQFQMGDKSKITLPGATKDALKALPAFQFAK
jgi:sporulation protein YlmC with PRC-barrel domain